MIDGTGADRVVQVRNTSDPQVDENSLILREAVKGDAVQIWRLANDPVVRNNSFDKKFISFDEHLEWYEKKLASSDARMWVLELAGVVVAQVRYDRTDRDAAEIDFSVAPAFRGQGIGSRALALTGKRACDELGIRRVVGVVNIDNKASARSFEKSGFSKVREEHVHGQPCYIFEKNCS